jgi:hypothetical protein
MTAKEILSLAKFAHNEVKARDFRDRIKPLEPWMSEFILNFYSLAKQLECEECARLCDEQGKMIGSTGATCAKAIRARGDA